MTWIFRGGSSALNALLSVCLSVYLDALVGADRWSGSSAHLKGELLTTNHQLELFLFRAACRLPDGQMMCAGHL